MARKRMIDPEFWKDEKLGECSRDERLLFMGLISNADDEGKGRASVKLLKSEIFPYDEDIKFKDMEKMMSNLMEKKFIIIYVIDSQHFYYLPKFSRHQVINKPTKSKLPELPENSEDLQLPEYYGSTTVTLPPKRKEVNIKEKNIYAEVVKLKKEEYDKLVEQFGQAGAEKRIMKLSLYIQSKGDHYKSHYATILNWELKDNPDYKNTGQKKSKFEGIKL